MKAVDPVHRRSRRVLMWLAATSVLACARTEIDDTPASLAAADTPAVLDTIAADAEAGIVASNDGAEASSDGWTAPPARTVRPPDGGGTDLPPNELGRIPILMYHLVGEQEGRWERERSRFRQDLELLYRRGYRPITVAELIDGRIELPAGYSPVVFTFDDASASQFRYIEQEDGTLEIDPTSAIGIWLDFQREHPDWASKATFCMLSGAAEGRAFFGDRGYEGQKTAWRHQKVRWLAEQGFELCNHTLWHMNMRQYGDDAVIEQIARLQLAVDSAVPGYRIRTLALPLGIWPANRDIVFQGAWTDPKTGRTTSYRNEAVLEVSGGSARSPFDPQFDPRSLPRVQVWQNELERELDRIDRTRYVSSGAPRAR